MSPRNWIRAAVVALGCALIVHGIIEIIATRDANAAPRTVGPTWDDYAVVGLPADPASIRTW